MSEPLPPPTSRDLFEEVLDEPISRTDDVGWRHGTYVTTVYHRAEDDTYWQASYRQSTDGETNELAEGYAQIVRVWPKTKAVTVYEPTP